MLSKTSLATAISDTTKPVLSVAPSIVIEVTTASAMDLVDGNVAITVDMTGPFIT
jgi:hypothetical protein